MYAFSITVRNDPDRELYPVETQLSRSGFDSPHVTSMGSMSGREVETINGRAVAIAARATGP
jgi:hypothetical protein